MIESQEAWAIMGIIICLAFIFADVKQKRSVK